MAPPSVAIFDLGGVLIDWNPRYLYRKLFAGDEAAVEEFLATVCTHEWNRCQDEGRPFAEGARLLKELHVQKAELIDAYFARFDEMMAGPIAGSVDILRELHSRDVPLYALSNFSAETYPLAVKRFDFLRLFEAVIISGEVRAMKPDRRIFDILVQRCGIDPACALFIDDVAVNVAAARQFGMRAIQFTDPAALRQELQALGLLA